MRLKRDSGATDRQDADALVCQAGRRACASATIECPAREGSLDRADRAHAHVVVEAADRSLHAA
jgi:hypothetical protein